MDVHFKLVSEEQSSTLLMNPIMQSVKGHQNSLPAECSPLTCSAYRNVSGPKSGLGAYYMYICTKKQTSKVGGSLSSLEGGLKDKWSGSA